VSLGNLGEEDFTLTTDWQEYSFECAPEEDIGRAGPVIKLASAGTAWVDLFQIVPVEAE